MKHTVTVSHDQVMGKIFAEDQEFARAGLSLTLEEGNRDALLVLMR